MMNYLRTAKSDREAIRVLISYLVGPKMINFVQRVGALYCDKRGQWTCTIDQMWGELDTSFSDLLSMERARIELLNFHQGGLKMKNYLSQFEVKVGKAHYRLNGAITLQLLQRGINQDLRDRMVDGNTLPTTFAT